MPQEIHRKPLACSIRGCRKIATQWCENEDTDAPRPVYFCDGHTARANAPLLELAQAALVRPRKAVPRDPEPPRLLAGYVATRGPGPSVAVATSTRRETQPNRAPSHRGGR
jgi:hypothetical protein